MSQRGKVQLTSIIIAPPDEVAEGDHLFATHAAWMKETHHRSGNRALLSYNVAKAPELSDPMNLDSSPTGNVCYVLTEVYETEAGVAEHFEQAGATWKEFADLGKWIERCQFVSVPSATVVHSLW